MCVYAGIILVSAMTAYLMFEIKMRLEMERHYLAGKYSMVAFDKSDGHTRSIATYEELFGPFSNDFLGVEDPYIGFFKRNDEFFLWIIDNDSNISLENSYHTNNLGFYSRKHYSVKRQGPEFRIGIIGDSVTASREMHTPWPDLLEDYLNGDAALVKRLGKTFKVYNLGIPGAGFPHFSLIAKGQAKALDVDLVVINYVESDFSRRLKAVSAGAGTITGGFIDFRAGPDQKDVAKLNVTCERPPVSFSNETCRQYFFLYMTPQLAHQPGKIQKVKQDIVNEYLQGQLWRSVYPYGLMKLLGKPVTLHHWRNPQLFHIPEQTEDEMLSAAVQSLRDVIDTHVNLIVTLNPLYQDAFPKLVEYRLTRLMLSRDPTLNVIVMRDRMPVDRGEREGYSWYNLPYDGHMSNKGGALYSQVLGDFLKEHLAAQRLLAAQHDVTTP